MRKGLDKTIEEINIIYKGIVKCNKAYDKAPATTKECIGEGFKSYMERYKTLVLSDYLKLCNDYSNIYGKYKPSQVVDLLESHISNHDLPHNMLDFLLELKRIKSKYYLNYQKENIEGLFNFYRSNEDNFKKLTKWIIQSEKERYKPLKPIKLSDLL